MTRTSQKNTPLLLSWQGAVISLSGFSSVFSVRVHVFVCVSSSIAGKALMVSAYLGWYLRVKEEVA